MMDSGVRVEEELASGEDAVQPSIALGRVGLGFGLDHGAFEEVLKHRVEKAVDQLEHVDSVVGRDAEVHRAAFPMRGSAVAMDLATFAERWQTARDHPSVFQTAKSAILFFQSP